MVGSTVAVMTPNNRIRHSAKGDLQLQNVTLDEQRKIADALVALQRIVETVQDSGARVAISADIKVKVLGGNNSDLLLQFGTGDPLLFDAQPPNVNVHLSKESAPVYESENGEERGVKRPRTSNDRPDWELGQESGDRSGSVDERNTSVQTGVPDNGAIMKFLGDWRQQWTQQGGWMFDHFNATKEDERRKKVWLQEQFDTHVGGVASNLNSQHYQIMQAITNNNNTLQWYEESRNKAHESAQSREEKWRLSSASFQDSGRQDREKAEKDIRAELAEQKANLEKQHKMLVQLMESQGLDLDQGDG